MYYDDYYEYDVYYYPVYPQYQVIYPQPHLVYYHDDYSYTSSLIGIGVFATAIAVGFLCL